MMASYQMKNLYRNAELAEEKNRILHALGYSQEPNVVAQILEFSLSVEVPPQDSIVTLSSVASNRYSYKQAWTFFANNIEKITKRYTIIFIKDIPLILLVIQSVPNPKM